MRDDDLFDEDDDEEKYDLVGIDGNAFSVMGYVIKAMKRENFSAADVSKYQKQAMSGDYNNLLRVSMEWVDKCNKKARMRK